MYDTGAIGHIAPSTAKACAEFGVRIGLNLAALIAAPKYGQGAVAVLHEPNTGAFMVLALFHDHGHIQDVGGKTCESLASALQYAQELAC